MFSRRFDSTSGEGITNAYDGFGRQTSSSTNMGGTTRTLGYGWDAAGNRASITHPDGTYFAAWYDALDRQYYMHVNGVAGIAYDYTNPDGTTAVRARVGIGTYYGYDGMQRLASMAHATGAPTDVSYAYTRNPAGQLASVTRTGDAYAWTGHYAVQRPYTTNGLNQYTDAGGAAFTYDANGNLSTSPGAAEVQTFVYDVENRLVGRTGTGTSPTVALAYDPLGRLYRVSSPTTDTRFLYDGDALVAEYDAAGAMLWRYGHWTGADVPVVAFQGSGLGTMRQLLPDHQGSIVAQADGNAAIVQVNTYDEYGIPGAGNQGRFQYTGQIWLPELGMYHYKARIYSPTLGRFLQTDPVGYENQFNLYGYAGNDPVNNVDPDGQHVTAIYDPRNRNFFVVDDENRRAHITQADTGYDFVNSRHTLPIPSGTYSILEHRNPSRYRLEGHDDEWGDDSFQGRTELRLHGRGQGYNDGCISVCTDAEWGIANAVISRTSTTTVPIIASGWRRLLGLLPIEGVRNFGRLSVLGPGQSLNYNTRTREVTLSTTRTGSRVPVTGRVCTMTQDESRCLR